jgi:hypothetical protein
MTSTSGSTHCPECRTLLSPTEQGNVLQCLSPTCKIGLWDPVANRGMFKTPSPRGLCWVTTGEGLTKMSKQIPAGAPLPEGYREGRS